MSATIQQLASYWKQGAASPRHAIEFVVRRAVPFGISFKDLEAYRISTWRHGGLPRMHLTQIFPGIETVNVNLLNLYQRKIGLSMDAGEVMSLCAIVRFLGARTVAEIGTYDGNTTLNLAANVPEGGCVTTIDLPPSWDRKFVYDVPNSHCNVTDRNSHWGRSSLQGHEAYENRITAGAGGSRRRSTGNELDPPFDLIFIDGCHYRDYVRRLIPRMRCGTSGQAE